LQRGLCCSARQQTWHSNARRGTQRQSSERRSQLRDTASYVHDSRSCTHQTRHGCRARKTQNTELALELGCACLCGACVFPSLSTNLVANAGRGFKTQNPSKQRFSADLGRGRWMRKISIHSLAW
jgi:hypothetical protein